MGKTGQGRPQKVARIVSGAQTGVDRAALDFARSRAIDHGGWVPRGRIAEDGPIPAVYRVTETETGKYRERTERNVLDSDGTLIIFEDRISGGTAFTRLFALERGKPCLMVDVGRDKPDVAEAVCSWIRRHRIAVLNVAGPRESQNPGIYAKSLALLERVFHGPKKEQV
jgi:hypothetical protein